MVWHDVERVWRDVTWGVASCGDITSTCWMCCSKSAVDDARGRPSESPALRVEEVKVEEGGTAGLTERCKKC